ncbi:hypothetical protein CBW54_00540 [Yersinia kristensenii]|nr:hypothetical protein CBW54_00540 [Yersinia kristensenii]
MGHADRMHGAGYYVDEISIPNGDITYVISTGDGADGQFSDLTVNKSGKQIASIKPDDKSMINNIEEYWIKNN